MVQSLYKNLLLVPKITWGIWTTSDKQCKVQKVEIWWATFVQKKIHSAKKLSTEYLSNITFNYLCENSPNSLSHFWIHKSFFTTRLVCIFFARTLHTFCKSSPSKCKWLSTAHVEIHQIPHVVIPTKNQFFFKVWSTLQCHEKEFFCTF